MHKNSFDQLKYRAQREGKRVEINNDVLVIDGVAVFSLSSGRINGNNGN